jgi:hypothetical protein
VWSVGQLYVEFAFEAFIGRSSIDDAFAAPGRSLAPDAAWSDERASSSHRLAGKADLLDVTEVGAAATAKNGEVTKLALQVGIAAKGDDPVDTAPRTRHHLRSLDAFVTAREKRF